MLRCTQPADHKAVNTEASSLSMATWIAKIAFWKTSGYHIFGDERSMFRNKAKEIKGNLIVGVKTEMSLVENNK